MMDTHRLGLTLLFMFPTFQNCPGFKALLRFPAIQISPGTIPAACCVNYPSPRSTGHWSLYSSIYKQS